MGNASASRVYPHDQGGPPKKRINKKLIVAAVVVVFVGVIVSVILLVTRANPLPDIKISLQSETQFMHDMSKKNGRDQQGDLYIDAKLVENGLSKKEDLNRYPLTFCAGHQIYQSGRRKNSLLSFRLSDRDWNGYVKRVARKYKPIGDGETGVLVIDPSTTKGDFVYIDESLDVTGIVVRRGGVLFVASSAGSGVVLRTGWILVESGGLFQAGSPYLGRLNRSMRLPTPSGLLRALDIVVATPNGYKYSDARSLGSEYSYKVYAPGVTKKGDPSTSKYTNYTGSDSGFCNMFGERCAVAVGFNGNVTLAGHLGSPSAKVVYTGSWSSWDTQTGKKWIGENELLTTNADSGAYPYGIEDTYYPTWGNLSGRDLDFKAGATELSLDDSFKGKIDHWRPGSKLLVTCKTKKYSSKLKSPDGRFPIWMGWEDEVQAKANTDANDEDYHISKLSEGVEVVTIKNVVPGTATVILQAPLKYNHANNKEIISRKDYLDSNDTTEISVDTRVHAGLLTRNIRISSELNPDAGPGGGANRWYHDKENEMNKSGTVLCNYPYKPDKVTNNEIYNACYYPCYNQTEGFNDYCKDGDGKLQQPTPNNDIKGSWLFGTHGMTGSNAILGAHTMAMLGSSVCFDGIEMFRLGIPGNFGKIARYPFHMHMAGFVRELRVYLPEGADPEKGDTRVAELVNSSVWPSYNRWATLHGTSTARIANNVCFVSMGSGIFTEDGCEVLNTIEHNLLATTLRCGIDSYYNKMGPGYIIPTVSSDSTFPSTIWLKNNHNPVLRNVLCDSFLPVTAIWWVPQHLAALRGLPAVILGDEELQLPGTACYLNAVGEPSKKCWLSQNKNTSERTPLAFTSDRLKDVGMSGEDGCLLHGDTNERISALLCSENVVYCHGGGISNFPDTYFRLSEKYWQKTTENFRYQMKPSWIPYDAHNECSDDPAVSGTVYSEPRWNERGKFQPFNRKEYNVFQEICATKSLSTDSNAIPVMISSLLTFNLAPASGGILFSPLWTKSACFMINCCFLSAGGGDAIIDELWNPIVSGVPFVAVGDAKHRFPNIYHTYYNLIADKAVSFPPNPTVVAGNKTFIGSGAIAVLPEYTAAGEPADGKYRDVSACLMLFDKISKDLFPETLWTNKPFKLTPMSVSYFYIYDNSTSKLYRGEWDVPRINEINNPDITVTNTTPVTKYPYICKEDKLFLTNDGKVVANSTVGIFLNRYARSIGNEICQALSSIKHCNTNLFKHDAKLRGIDALGTFGCDKEECKVES